MCICVLYVNPFLLSFPSCKSGKLMFIKFQQDKDSNDPVHSHMAHFTTFCAFES